eukprot:2835778-Pyramimonas_sp.AAC.1
MAGVAEGHCRRHEHENQRWSIRHYVVHSKFPAWLTALFLPKLRRSRGAWLLSIQQNWYSFELTLFGLCRVGEQGKHEGVGALYSGIHLKGLHTLFQTFLYFYAYSFLKNLYTARFGKIGEMD